MSVSSPNCGSLTKSGHVTACVGNVFWSVRTQELHGEVREVQLRKSLGKGLKAVCIMICSSSGELKELMLGSNVLMTGISTYCLRGG